jgi:hypothetical protein
MNQLLIVIFISMFAVSISWASERLDAIITDTNNSVAISTSPAAPWQKAQKGMKLSSGTAVKTGPLSSAEMIYDDGTGVRIESNANVTIERAEIKKGVSEYLISLFSGRMLNTVKHNLNKRRFKVQSPVCVMSVRGTVFVMDCSTTASTVAVYEGVVEAQSIDKQYKEPVQVNSNKQLTIQAGLAPGSPQPLAEEFERYRKTVADIFERRINWYRSHMEEIRRMNQKYMDNWRKEQEKTMEEFRNQFKDEKRDLEYRKKKEEFERELDSR